MNSVERAACITPLHISIGSANRPATTGTGWRRRLRPIAGWLRPLRTRIRRAAQRAGGDHDLGARGRSAGEAPPACRRDGIPASVASSTPTARSPSISTRLDPGVRRSTARRAGCASARWAWRPERFVPARQPKGHEPQLVQLAALRSVGAASIPRTRAPATRTASLAGSSGDGLTPSSPRIAA